MSKRNITAPQTPPHKDVPQSPTITAQMEHTPKLASSVRTLKEGLSVLEQEFIDFKERTLYVLHQNNSSQQENCTLYYSGRETRSENHSRP